MFDNTATASAALQSKYFTAMDKTPTDLGSVGADTNLYGMLLESGDAAADAYIQFFKKAASGVTLGTTVPDWTVKVPKGLSVWIPADRALMFSAAGWSVGCTTTRTGSTAATNKPDCTFFFSQS